jgi:hypothetical protein
MSTQHQGNPSQPILQFLHDVPLVTQDIVNAIITAISSTKHNFDMAIKWRQLTFAMDQDFHHWICAISITKTCVVSIFASGGCSMIHTRNSRLEPAVS